MKVTRRYAPNLPIDIVIINTFLFFFTFTLSLISIKFSSLKKSFSNVILIFCGSGTEAGRAIVCRDLFLDATFFFVCGGGCWGFFSLFFFFFFIRYLPSFLSPRIDQPGVPKFFIHGAGSQRAGAKRGEIRVEKGRGITRLGPVGVPASYCRVAPS